MKIKIGDTVYDSKHTRMAVRLSENEKSIIMDMPKGHDVLCAQPKHNKYTEDIKVWASELKKI